MASTADNSLLHCLICTPGSTMTFGTIINQLPKTTHVNESKIDSVLVVKDRDLEDSGSVLCSHMDSLCR